jgi:hypothetical protein
MAMTQSSALSRAPRPSSLADVVDLILDKGLVIDAYVRVSVAGIELLTVDARIVIASVDTYLRFAEAVNRLDLSKTEAPGLRALTGDGSDSDDDDGESDGNDDTSDDEEQASITGGSNRGHRETADQPDQTGDGDREPGLIGRIADRARFDR